MHCEIVKGCNHVYAFALEMKHCMLQSVIDVIRWWILDGAKLLFKGTSHIYLHNYIHYDRIIHNLEYVSWVMTIINSLNCCNGVNRSLFTINFECFQLRVASKRKSVLHNLHITNNIKRYLIFANINLHFTTTNIITSPQHTLYHNLHITNNIKRYLIFANINLHFTTTNIITSPQHTLYRHSAYQYIWFLPRIK